MNIANILTISRIVAVPAIAALLMVDGRGPSMLAGILFTLATFTDWLDGYLARKHDMETDLGRLLDPLADKLLIATVLIMLIPLGRVAAWIVAVIIGREMAVTGLRAIAADKNIIMAAGWLGKYKTSFQCAALIPLTVHYDVWGIQSQAIGEVFLWIALFFTIWSGWDYMYSYISQTLREGNA